MNNLRYSASRGKAPIQAPIRSTTPYPAVSRRPVTSANVAHQRCRGAREQSAEEGARRRKLDTDFFRRRHENRSMPAGGGSGGGLRRGAAGGGFSPCPGAGEVGVVRA